MDARDLFGVRKMLLDGTVEMVPQLFKFTKKIIKLNHTLETRDFYGM